MAAGWRQLFIYWRCSSVDAPAALTAARTLQQALRERHPGLICALYLRSDATGPEATLLETYAVEAGPMPEGVGPALQQAIDAAAVAALTPWQRGARHVEVFDAVEG